MNPKAYEAAIADFIQSVGVLVRRVRAAADPDPISMSESMVLSRLVREGPATTADLARSEGVKPQSMGATIAALEEGGLVDRKPHPTDRRQVMIQLTAKGAALRKSMTEAKQAWLAQAISRLDERDQQTLFAAGKIIRRLVEPQ